MPLNLDAIGEKIGPKVKEYTWKDVVLYALGVGAGFDDLDYCYENTLKAVPSFSIGAVFDFLAEAAIRSGANLAGILHGEQDIIFHQPIPVEGTLTTEGAITRIYDKGPGKGALVVAEADSWHSNGRKIFTNIFTLFSRLDGGFGGQNAPRERVEFPDREPDFEERALPSGDQPLLYRLSGDIFALHVDPEFARSSGFEKPIMHGLCTHGYACRAVVKHLFPGEPERMSRFRNRFSRPLYPGVSVRTQIWKLEEGRAVFRTINDETGEVVIDHGLVEWIDRAELARRQAAPEIDFDGQVAIVTGAGAGLGRAYALELARRGARVLVNDLGGARDGSGEGSQRAADAVVQEIVDAGGQALANYDSVATVEGGEAMVQQAWAAWGRVDVLINNAGILRDRSLLKLEQADWDAVLDVHLKGAYCVTRPAFAAMKSQGYGRIIMTTSAAGLFGNFGQSNYGAAKMGVLGLMSTLELEGARYDIKVNAVAPIAATRLTEDILPPNLLEALQPEAIVPLTLFLCCRDCPVSGDIYNAGAGLFGRAAIVAGPGALVGGEQPATPEQIADRWEEICSLEGAAEHGDAIASLGPMMDALQGGGPDKQESASAQAGAGEVFARMPEAFQADRAAGVEVIFQFSLSGEGGGEWHAVIEGGTCQVGEGAHASPTTTILMEAGDFLDLIAGKLNAMAAYTSGTLKIKGDLMKSQLIEKLFKF